jgi:uncharacterized repeat protein (TIGR01451 family)
MTTKTTILAATAALLLAAGQAGAAGTAANTAVNNTASVGYSVGGVSQTAVNSNTTTFVVDRRINLTVAEVGGAYTDVAPGATGQVLTFTVTNSTNAPLDFRLTATQLTTGTLDAFGHADGFDVTGVQIFVDSNANGVYDPGVDTATFLDEIPADTTKTVFIVANIPLGQPDGNTAGLELTAIAAEPGGVGVLGSDSTQTAGAENPAAVDTVFGDGAGDIDAARDGRHSKGDAYRIRAAALVVTKTSTVISDPFNGTTNPKRIPGAVVEYCVTVQNNGSTTATAVVLTDVITGQPVTFLSGSLFTVSTGAVCTGGTSAADPSPAGTVTATFANLPAAAGVAMRFRVTIN